MSLAHFTIRKDLIVMLITGENIGEKLKQGVDQKIIQELIPLGVEGCFYSETIDDIKFVVVVAVDYLAISGNYIHLYMADKNNQPKESEPLVNFLKQIINPDMTFQGKTDITLELESYILPKNLFNDGATEIKYTFYQ